ncbi:MAG: hypothetical protein ACRDZQ_09045 [Acidimicrobiales bacterium]
MKALETVEAEDVPAAEEVEPVGAAEEGELVEEEVVVAPPQAAAASAMMATGIATRALGAPGR